MKQTSSLILNQIDFSLPCKTFNIHCSVTADDRLPVVTEFVLRLIRTSESITIDQLQTFFGFSQDETAAVVTSLINQKLISWGEDDESIVLTEYAISKFEESTDNIPRFTKIEDWAVKVDFDQVSFSLVSGNKALDPVNSVLIPVKDENISNSNNMAEKAFTGSFVEFTERNRKASNNKFDLYKISHVKTFRSFYKTFPIQLFLDSKEGFDISREFMAVDELNFGTKLPVIQATTDALECEKNNYDHSYFLEFIDIFDDEILKNYVTFEKFSYREYLRDVILNKQISYPAGTIPVFGATYLESNSRSFANKIENGIRKAYKKSDKILEHIKATWLAPSISTWGRTSEIGVAANRIATSISKINADDSKNCLKFIFPSEDQQNDWSYVTKYKSLIESGLTYAPFLVGGFVEIIIIPSIIAYVVFHYVPDDKPYISLPVGFITTDPIKLGRINEYMSRQFQLGTKIRSQIIPRAVLGNISFESSFSEFKILPEILFSELNSSNTLHEEIVEDESSPRENVP